MASQHRTPEELVRARFEVKQFFALPDGELEFQVAYTPATRESFAALLSDLASTGMRPELSGSTDECVLTVRRSHPAAGNPPRLPVFLVLFTIASVAAFGLLQEFVYMALVPQISPYLAFFEFALPLAAVMGAHELAQRYMARRRKGGKASSYLIPGIPYVTSFLPSLGFLSSQREAALNRDALFDTVMVGPLAVLAVAAVFFAAGAATAVTSAVPFVGSQVANSTVTINPGVLQMAIDALILKPVPAGYVAVSPLSDGAAIAFILAFIGFLPMVSYDGGYLSSLVLGPKRARLASYLSVLLLLALDTPNYWALAVVVLILAGRPFQLKLVDEVSPLSGNRRWLLVAALVLAAVCVPIPQNIATFPLG